MPASTQQSRRRKLANRRQSAATGAQPEPTPQDRRRWEDLREGISPEELAARENVRLPTILKSRDTMRNYLARYSAQSAETEVRRVVIDSLPAAANYLAEALTATMPVTKMVLKQRRNYDTGMLEDYMDEETTLIPDHATRGKAHEQLTKSLAAIQPKTPMVQVDARSQTNIQNGQSGLGGGQALSFESITRQIRAERGLSLGPGESAAPQQAISAPVEVDYELAEEIAEEMQDEDAADDEIDAADVESTSEAIS